MNLTEFKTKLATQNSRLENIPQEELIKNSIAAKESVVLPCGALATWTPVKSTGRRPKDTYIVRHPESEKNIDWSSEANNSLDPDLFNELLSDAFEVLLKKEKVYITERVVGADVKYALPTKLITDRALSSLFSYHMFRPVPENIEESIFADNEFTVIALPSDMIQTEKYQGKIREENGKTSDAIIAMDFDQKICLVYGSMYVGSIKKSMFTVMNYLLPEHQILPLHCSANYNDQGETSLFLGLSGTGKTTLSADPKRALIGDDEHGWSDSGIANFENGCYAKLINLDPKKEPEIYNATFHEAAHTEHGAIIENVMVYPNGSYDLNDSRLTENSRVSYPLKYLSNIKDDSLGGHPKTILFLTADANGVLPPVAKLNKDQAMLWFLMGYTSKLAGTETGITEPQSTFSRFFGGPFMPRNPSDYTSLFGEKIEKHETDVYLINTGWTGGSYGVGQRIDIAITRSIVEAALSGDLKDVEYSENKRFHLMVPQSCPHFPNNILNPKNTWQNKELFEEKAQKLAQEFSDYFDKTYGASNITEEVRKQCPGK